MNVRRPGEQTIALFRRLKEMTSGGSSWQRWFGTSSDDLLALLREILLHANAGMIPELMPMVWWPCSKVATTVAGELARIVGGMVPHALWNLDTSLRERGFGYGGCAVFHWQEIMPEHLEALPAGLSDGELACVLGLLACHPSGWVREKAIGKLRNIEGPVPFPFLLIRCSDWVPAVRTQAWAAVRERLVAAQAPTAARHLALVETVRKAERVDFQEMGVQIERLIGENLAPAACEDVWKTADRRLKRALASHATRWPMLADVLIGCGRTDADPVVRTMALQAQIARADAESALAWGLKDRVVTVRRMGWRHLRESAPDSVAILKAGLMDAHASLREEARFWAARMHSLEPRTVYREAVANARTAQDLAIGLSGLGETGTADEADSIAPYIDHARLRVSEAAWKALARLAPDRWKDGFLELLAQSRGAVHKLATAVLRRHRHWIDGSRLRDMIRRQPHDSSRKRLFSLLPIFGKWECLISLLILAADTPPLSGTDPTARLRSWLLQANRSQMPPTAAQQAEIARLWPGVQALLPSPLAASLEFFLPRSSH